MPTVGRPSSSATVSGNFSGYLGRLFAGMTRTADAYPAVLRKSKDRRGCALYAVTFIKGILSWTEGIVDEKDIAAALTIGAVTVVGVLGFAGAAQAHVTVNPSDAAQGGYGRIAWVPTESDTASTTKPVRRRTSRGGRSLGRQFAPSRYLISPAPCGRWSGARSCGAVRPAFVVPARYRPFPYPQRTPRHANHMSSRRPTPRCSAPALPAPLTGPTRPRRTAVRCGRSTPSR